MWHNILAVLAIFVHFITAIPTWPSSIDEIEDLMFLQSGYRSLGFSSAVTPCSNSVTEGFRTAAGFVRTAFHDVAAHDELAGTGGLDASVGFECEAPFSTHNSGPAFAGAMAYYSGFFNSKASMADLIALGTYASVRSCGGPIIAMKAGRIDATSAGANSLPDVADSAQTLTGRFAKMGFTPQEMIQLVACGHTLGGVHPGVNPAFNPQDPSAAQAAANNGGVLTFDSTDAAFDNTVARQYVDGTTRNPLVTGPEALNSDNRVYQSDGNVTIRAMAADSNVFQGMCQIVFQKMLERVPSNVRLSDVIQPYDVKPGQLYLNVLDDGSLAFSGEVRIRTVGAGISKVQIIYTDKSGNSCNGCSIDAQLAGSATGFDDEAFSFYGFSAKVDSISSFKVAVTLADGQVRIYDNNGQGFTVNDNAFVQVSSSSLNGNQLKVVVAVRASQVGQPQITLSTKSAFEFNRLPTIATTVGSVSKICGGSQWNYYSATFTVSEADVLTAKLDVSLGGAVVDGFRSINFPSSGTTPSCTSSVSTTLSTSTLSSTTSTVSNTTSTSTTSSSTTSSTITSSSISTSSSTTSTTSSTTSTVINSGLSITNGTYINGTLADPDATISTSSSTTSISSSSTSLPSSSTTTTSSSSSMTTSETSDISSGISGTGKTSTTTDTGLGQAKLSGTNQVGSLTSSSKLTETSKTSSSSSLSVPAWSAWENFPPSPGSFKSSGSSGKSTTTSTSTSTGKGYYTTADIPAPKPKHDDAQAALASVYQSLRNKPAPSGGTDGGNKNVEGLDLDIKVSSVKPTITGTTAVFTNTVVYVTTFANSQESKNVYSTGWVGWSGNGGSNPTQGAGSSGWGSWGPAESGSGSGSGSDTGSNPGTGSNSGSGSVPASASGSPKISGPTASKTGLVAQYTGAAHTVRTGGVAVGIVAVFGAVVIIL